MLRIVYFDTVYGKFGFGQSFKRKCMPYKRTRYAGTQIYFVNLDKCCTFSNTSQYIKQSKGKNKMRKIDCQMYTVGIKLSF